MMNKKTSFEVFVSVFFILFVFAEGFQRISAKSISERLSDQHFIFKEWDNTNGLPVNSVSDITFDERGYLWAATEAGLVSFNGREFKTYNPGNTPGMTAAMTYNVISSVNGGIWASTANSLIRIENNSFTVHDIRKQHDITWITAIAEDSDGIVWFGTNEGNIYRFRQGVAEKKDAIQNLINDQVQVLSPVKNGVWIGTSSGLYSVRSEGDAVQKYDALNRYNIRTVLQTSDADLWIGTFQNGLIHYDLHQESITIYGNESGLHDNFVNALMQAKDGSLWIGTGTAGIFVKENGEINILEAVSDRYTEIRALVSDPNGDYWASTAEFGLVYMGPAVIRTLTAADGLSSDVVLSIFQDSDGEKWVGTAGSGVNRIKNGEISAITRNEGLAHDVILGTAEHDGFIYITTGLGLSIYDKETNRVVRNVTSEDGLASSTVYAAYPDSQNRLWVTTRNGGIYHFQSHEKFEQLTLSDAFDNVEFLNVFEDDEGNVWFGATPAAMVKFGHNGEISEYILHDQHPVEMVVDFYQEDSGHLWIATDNGLLVKQEGDIFQHFGTIDGLLSNSAYRIIERDDYLYISGREGIQRLHKSELKILRQSEALTNIMILDQNDGMLNREANGGVFPAGWKMKDSTIWFPTMQGVAVVGNGFERPMNRPLNVVIESVKIGDVVYDLQEEIVFPAGVYNIEISYAAPEFFKPESIHYLYRIRELRNDWQQVQNRNVAYLTSLNPGSYTFEVIAEQIGVESEIASISFDVEPFFYQTRWFTFLVLTGLFLAGYFVHLFYAKMKQGKEMEKEINEKTKEIKERNRLLETLLKDLENQNKVLKDVAWVQSHELRGPLSKILGMVDVLKNYEDYDSVEKNEDQLLDEIDTAAKNLDEIIRKLIADIDEIENKGEV